MYPIHISGHQYNIDTQVGRMKIISKISHKEFSIATMPFTFNDFVYLHYATIGYNFQGFHAMWFVSNIDYGSLRISRNLIHTAMTYGTYVGHFSLRAKILRSELPRKNKSSEQFNSLGPQWCTASLDQNISATPNFVVSLLDKNACPCVFITNCKSEYHNTVKCFDMIQNGTIGKSYKLLPQSGMDRTEDTVQG